FHYTHIMENYKCTGKNDRRAIQNCLQLHHWHCLAMEDVCYLQQLADLLPSRVFFRGTVLSGYLLYLLCDASILHLMGGLHKVGTVSPCAPRPPQQSARKAPASNPPSP